MSKWSHITFEPPLKSYFLMGCDGSIMWAGAENVVVQLLVDDGFNLENAREAVLYARSYLGGWIELNKFRRSQEFTMESMGSVVDTAVMRCAVSEADIDRLIRGGPEFAAVEEVDAGDIERLSGEVANALVSLQGTFRTVRGKLMRDAPRMSAEDLIENLHFLNSLLNFIKVLTVYLSRRG
jgi:hypothetical protein